MENEDNIGDLRQVLSTALSEQDAAVGIGGGTPPPETGDENLSIEEVLRKEARAQDKAAAEARKAEKAEKAEIADGEKKEAPEVKDNAEEKPKEEDKAAEEKPQKDVAAEKPDDAGEKETAKPTAQSEGNVDRIPSRLLPRAREVWWNTPGPVRAEFDRMEREHAEAAQKYEASTKFHEELRQYEDMAKGANTTIKAALDRYVGIDKMLAADFGRGLVEVAQAHGKNPTEAVAQFMRSAGVTPQQLGAYLQGQPAQPQAQQQPQARPQVDPVAQQALQRVQQLEAQLQQQQVASQQERVQADIIAPFAAQHPRFEELQDDIAFFLKSGRIPTSLSPVERLEVAYDMAERLAPTPIKPQGNLAEPAVKAPASDAGTKSVRGAPSTGKSQDTDSDDETDLVTILRKEARKLAS